MNSNFLIFDLINLIASLSSLILSVLAIMITLHLKRESDDVNKETTRLLIDVKTDAKALALVDESAMSELREYGKTSREVTRQLINKPIENLQVSNSAAVDRSAPKPEVEAITLSSDHEGANSMSSSGSTLGKSSGPE